MADRQFNPLGNVSAPAGWTLPANLQLLLKNVYASFDGTSAAGAFLPCLEIVSDSGHTVGSYPCATQVAAGASADTTWFPRVSGGGASGKAVTPDWGTYFIDSVTVGAGSAQTSTWHASSGTALLNIPGIGSPTFLARGVYAVTAWIQSSDAWTTTALAGARIAYGNPTGFVSRATGAPDAGGQIHEFEVTLTAQADANATVDVTFENFDTASRTLFSNQVLVQQVYAY